MRGIEKCISGGGIVDNFGTYRSEEHPLIVGNSLGLMLPAKVKVENITPVPLVLLVIQA